MAISSIGSMHAAWAAALALSASSAAFAQTADSESELEVSGSVRLRYEAIDGQARTGFNTADDLLSTRVRLQALLDTGAWRFGAELIDSRAFLDDPATPVSTGDVNAAELVQAYAALDWPDLWGAPASLQVGRFTLNLGSRRIVAADDYRNTTNGYTGVRFDLGEREGFNGTLIYVSPQTRLPEDRNGIDDQDIRWDREGADAILFGGVANAPLRPMQATLQATYFGFREDDAADAPTRDRELDTFGLRLFRAPQRNASDFDFELMAQRGSISASTAANAIELDVDAWFAHAEIGRQFDAPWRPRITLVGDYVSGDEPGGDYERFDTLFGMRRAEIAPSGLYNAVGRANLASVGARIEVAPSAQFDGFASLRGLWLASDTDAFSTSGVRDASGASGDYAGLQLDMRLRYWLVPDQVRLEANAVYLNKGRFLEEAPNLTNSRDTAYAAFDVVFVF